MKQNLFTKLFIKNKNKKVQQPEKEIKVTKVKIEQVYVSLDRSDPLKFQDEINNELWLEGISG